LEHIAVEEKEGAERLILGRGGDAAVRGQVREELADLIRPHLFRVALVVEEDEALAPVDVGALGADAIMPEPQAAPDLLEERRFIGHGSTPGFEVNVVAGWGDYAHLAR
jgi:hypothetical protein